MAKEQLNHVNREPFSSFMEREVSIAVYAVGIGVHPTELWYLALQFNVCTSQGIVSDHPGQGL
jgi:hypothetical protein